MHCLTDLLLQVTNLEPTCVSGVDVNGGLPRASASLIRDPEYRYVAEGNFESRLWVNREEKYDWVTVRVTGHEDEDPADLVRELIRELSMTRRPRRPAIREEVVL